MSWNQGGDFIRCLIFFSLFLSFSCSGYSVEKSLGGVYKKASLELGEIGKTLKVSSWYRWWKFLLMEMSEQIWEPSKMF